MKPSAWMLLFLAMVAVPASPAGAADRIFYLDLRAGRVLSANPDGTDLKVLLEGHRTGMDGIAVDAAAGLLYWTNMGKVSADDGSIERMELASHDPVTIVPAGGTFTAKQLKLDKAHGKLYWSDREGMRVMRANLDGSDVETLVVAGSGDEDRADARHWCVGIAVDTEHGRIYWTQKGGNNANLGVIRGAPIEMAKGQDPAHRKDIQTLYSGLPEPIDLDVDASRGTLYWTDRGDPPRGNTVNRAPADGSGPVQILVSGLKEGIGMALDLKHRRMFYTDLGGNVYSANLDGSNAKAILTGQGTLTGIAYADVNP